MQNNVNDEVYQDKWIRPWDEQNENIKSLSDRDERFFPLVIKGALMWLNKNLIMYGESIRHYIFNTGSSYLYLENNGYEYEWCETSGEDYMYMETPRCIVTLGSFRIPEEELTSNSILGNYERVSNAKDTFGQIVSYNANMKRIPIEFSMNLKYIFSTFNESIIFVQELFEKILFQRYFNIIYLGQELECSIEFSKDCKIDYSEIDLASKEINQKTMDIEITICTNLPVIDTKTEVKSSRIISSEHGEIVDMKSKKELAKFTRK